MQTDVEDVIKAYKGGKEHLIFGSKRQKKRGSEAGGHQSITPVLMVERVDRSKWRWDRFQRAAHEEV